MPKTTKKDQFDLLDEELKTNIEHYSEEELNAMIAQTAKDDAALMEAKKEDQHLAEIREALKDASADYTSGHKFNMQRIKFARTILHARGKDSGSAATAGRAG